MPWSVWSTTYFDVDAEKKLAFLLALVQVDDKKGLKRGKREGKRIVESVVLMKSAGY